MVSRLFKGWRKLWWLLLLLPVVAYLSLPWWAGVALARALAPSGLTVMAFEPSYPGLASARIGRLVLEGHSMLLELTDVDIEYDWQALSAGQVGVVSIARASLQLQPAGPAAPVEAGALLLGVPGQLESLWERLPAEVIRLEAFTVADATLTAVGDALLTKDALRIAASGADFDLSANAVRGGALAARVAYEDSVASLELAADARTGALELAWNLPGWRVAGSAPLRIATAGWELGPGLTAVGDQPPLRVQASLDEAQGGWDAEHPEVRFAGAWSMELSSAFGMLTGAGGFSAQANPAAVVMDMTTGSGLHGEQLAIDDIVLEDVRVELPSATQLLLDLATTTLRASELPLQVSAASLTWQEYVTGGAAAVTLQDLVIDPERVRAQWELGLGELRGAGTLSAALEDFGWRLAGNLEQVVTRPILARLLRSPVLDYELDKGSIAVVLDARGRGAERYSGTLDVSLVDLSARYGEYPIVGIAGGLDVRIDSQGWRLTSKDLRAQGMDVGFLVSELNAQLMLDDSRVLTVTDAEAKALGGTLNVAEVRYDIDAGASAFPVQLGGIELAQVLALEGDNITGSAVLDGSLPVVVDDYEVSISGGRLVARPPGGVLRYLGAQAAAQSLEETGVGFAISALGDFRFDVLEVGIDYAANGDLLLAVRLQGFNPAFESGRPIHYNLNVSENIPALLQSLQLSEEFGRQLEQRLKN